MSFGLVRRQAQALESLCIFVLDWRPLILRCGIRQASDACSLMTRSSTRRCNSLNIHQQCISI